MLTSQSFNYHSWNLFAAAFCKSTFLLFSYPIITAWSLGHDDNIVYWFGSFVFWWTLPILPFFVIIFAVQVVVRPRKSLILGTIIIPSVTIFLLGGMLQGKAGHLADKLRNRDCGTFPKIRKLELSLFDAQEKHKECLQTALHENVPFNGCSDYKKWEDEKDEYEKDWAYLEYMEANFECTGFCTSAAPLWMYPKEAGKDPCAAALASHLESKVMSSTLQLMGYPIFLVFASVCWVFSVKPSIHELRTEKRKRERLFGPEKIEDVWPRFDLPAGGLKSWWKNKHPGTDQPKREPLFLPSQPLVQPPPITMQPAPVQVVTGSPASPSGGFVPTSIGSSNA